MLAPACCGPTLLRGPLLLGGCLKAPERKIEKLPIEEWRVRFYPDFIAVAAHLNGGGYWTKYRLSEFPQDFIGRPSARRSRGDDVSATGRAVNSGADSPAP